MVSKREMQEEGVVYLCIIYESMHSIFALPGSSKEMGFFKSVAPPPSQLNSWDVTSHALYWYKSNSGTLSIGE